MSSSRWSPGHCTSRRALHHADGALALLLVLMRRARPGFRRARRGLRLRPSARRLGSSPSSDRCSSRTKSATDSVSPRRDGSMLAARSRRADSLPEPAHSANALRDVFAPLSKRDVDQTEHLLAKAFFGGPRRGLVAVDAHQPRVDPRDRPEHRRRHHAVAPDVAEVADLRRWARRSPCRPVRPRAARRPRPAPSPSRCGSTGTRRAGAAVRGRRRCKAGWRPGRWAHRRARTGSG